MKTALHLAGITALVALAAFIGVSTFEEWHLGHQGQRTVAQGEAAEAAAAQLLAQTQANENAALMEGLYQADQARKMAERRLKSIEKTIAQQLDRTNDSLAKVAAIAPEVQKQVQTIGPAAQAVQKQVEATGPVLQNAVHITGQVDTALADQLPLFTDCDHNPDCLFNRYQGSAKAFEKTMQQIALAMPAEANAITQLTQEVSGAAKDVHTLTSRVVGPQPWWKRTLHVAADVGAAATHWFPW